MKNQSSTVKKEILKGLTGICRPGQLTAIMGPSGAGKTTLLNILSSRVSKDGITGKYYANGHEYSGRKFSKFAGYVMQNDILLETMTPRETFQFTADLRIKGTPEEKRQKVNQLIKDLKLECAADTYIGGKFLKGISGGERKRTSIGVELITDPNLLVLDEPTSGLDSFTAFLLVSLLKKLAVKGGKNIIFTIHQPSSDIFFLFDNLMMLAKGKFVYQGPADYAIDHFAYMGYVCPEYCNPADYFIEVTHPSDLQNEDEKLKLMYERYEATIQMDIEGELRECRMEPLNMTHKNKEFFSSMKVIAKRSYMNALRNPILLKGRLFQTAFVTFFICIIFFKISNGMEGGDPSLAANKQVIYDINGSLFFFCITLFMASCMSVVLTFPLERAVFLREYSANMYSVPAYYFGRSSTDIPLAIFFPAIMTAISYYIIGYNSANAGKMFTFMLILVTLSLAGNAMGLFIGCILGDGKIATNVVPTAILPWTLFAGIYINIETIPGWLRWITYTSPFRYALEGFMWNQYTDFELGTSQLDAYNFTLGVWKSWALLFIVGLVLRVLALISLKLLVRKLQ